MTDIETVTRFKTTDGQMFDDLQNAESHQAELSLVAALKVFQGGRPGGIGISSVIDFLGLHPHLVRAYLDSLEDQ